MTANVIIIAITSVPLIIVKPSLGVFHSKYRITGEITNSCMSTAKYHICTKICAKNSMRTRWAQRNNLLHTVNYRVFITPSASKKKFSIYRMYVHHLLAHSETCWLKSISQSESETTFGRTKIEKSNVITTDGVNLQVIRI